MARVDLFPAQIPIGRVTFNGVDVPVYAKPELLRALRAVQESVNAVESGLTALEITNVPAGGIAATDVQAALNELDTEKQPKDATLTALAGASTAADKLIYWTGVDVASVTDFSAFARTVLDDADAAAMRATLALGSMATQSASSVAITGGTINGASVGATTPSTGKFTTVEATSTVKSISTTVGGLPAAATAGAGARAFVTDANSTTFLAAAVGGGANKVPVVSDGTSWYVG